jgi:hypothetical protein
VEKKIQTQRQQTRTGGQTGGQTRQADRQTDQTDRQTDRHTHTHTHTNTLTHAHTLIPSLSRLPDFIVDTPLLDGRAGINWWVAGACSPPTVAASYLCYTNFNATRAGYRRFTCSSRVVQAPFSTNYYEHPFTAAECGGQLPSGGREAVCWCVCSESQEEE